LPATPKPSPNAHINNKISTIVHNINHLSIQSKTAICISIKTFSASKGSTRVFSFIITEWITRQENIPQHLLCQQSEKLQGYWRSSKQNSVSHQGQKRRLSCCITVVEKTFYQSACAIEYQLARLTLTGSTGLARLCSGQKPA